MKSNAKDFALRLVKTVAVPLVIWLVMEIIVRSATGMGVINSTADIRTLFRNLISSLAFALGISTNLNCGRMDLSMGAQMYAGVIFGGNIALTLGLGGVGVLILSMAVGALCGLLTGFIFIKLRILPMVLGLGMTLVFECICFAINKQQGVTLYGQPGVEILSNITFIMNTQPFSLRTCMGEEFPSNHVSHSFGQFIQYDGDEMVTVDHGDAYPRSFVLQAGGRELELLGIYGDIGDNVTNAIGSGFEVSDDSYLFLGCSAPQDGGSGQPWNVFLARADKNLSGVELTWLTDSGETINCARLVKLDGNTLVALWAQGDDLHYQVLDGQGARLGEEQALPGVPMPPTQPVVQDGSIRWIQAVGSGAPHLYTLTVG